jgi:phosphoribosylformylglycinamidine synthase subunit PurL
LGRTNASVGHGFAEEGDVVLLIGDEGRLDAGELLGRAEGRPAPVDLERQVATIREVEAAARAGLLRSAHDVAGGGLAVALAESAIAGGIGCRVGLPAGRRDDEVLFGEGGGRIVLTCRPEHETRIPAATRIGVVGGDRIEVRVGGAEVSLGVDEARRAYERGLPEALS